jgi:hypothetical protein
MTAADFREIAPGLTGMEEHSQGGLPAFRVEGSKSASLASEAEDYGSRMLTLERHPAFVPEGTEIFRTIPDGWGKMGHRIVACRRRARMSRSEVTAKKRGKRRL